MTNKEIIHRLEKMLLFAESIPEPQGHQEHWEEASRLDKAMDKLYGMIIDLQEEVAK